MKNFSRKPLAAMIGMAFASPLLFAQQATDVGRIAVENNPGGGMITQEESPKARSSVTKESLDRMTPSANVYQALQLLPGVNTFSQDATGLFGGGIRMRGFAGDQLGLTINGAPVNDSGSFSVFPQEYTDTENLCEVFVTQGSTDTEAPHVGATGGNIGLVTCGPSAKRNFRLAQSFGGLRYSRTFARFDTGTLGFADTKVFVSYSKSKADKFKGYGGADRDHVDVGIDMKPMRDLSLSTSVVWNQALTNNYRTLTKTQIAQSGPYLDFSNVAPSHLTPVNGTAQSETTPGEGYYRFNVNPFRNYLWTGKAEYRVAKDLSLSAEPYFWYGFGTGGGQIQTVREGNAANLLGGGIRDVNGDGDTRDTVLAYGSSVTKTYRPGITLKGKYQYGNNSIVAGYWMERARHIQTGPRVRIDNSGNTFSAWLDDESQFLLRQNGTPIQARDWLTVTTASSFFVTDTISLMQDKLSLQVGLRHLDTKRDFTNFANEGNTGSPNTFGAATYNVVTKYSKLLPSLGAKYQLDERQQVFANVAQNYRIPSNFVYSGLLSGGTFVNGALSGYTLGKANVTPETSTNLDVGYRYQVDRFTFSGSLFYVDYKNRIARSYDPTNARVTDFNVGDSTIKGFELESGYAVGGGFTTYGSLSYTRSTIKNNLQNAAPPAAAEATAGKQFPDTPKWMAALGVNWARGGWFAGAAAKYTGRSYSTLVNDESMDPYTTVDANAGYKFGALGSNYIKNAELRLNVVNLFSKDYLRINSPSGSSFTVRALGAGGSAPSYYIGAPRFTSVTFRADF